MRVCGSCKVTASTATPPHVHQQLTLAVPLYAVPCRPHTTQTTQTWVKTPQVLMRDRLMSNYTVKPALARLKRTLLGLGGALVASMMLLAVMPPPPVNSASYYYAPSSSSSSYSATISSSSSSAAAGDYEAAVSKYEPWAVAGADEDADAAAAGDEDMPRFDMRTHMMLE